MIRVYFKDEGQDCLWWDIDSEGIVQDCNMQAWLWKGIKVDMTMDLRSGRHLAYTSKDGTVWTWKHPIERVRRPPATRALQS